MLSKTLNGDSIVFNAALAACDGGSQWLQARPTCSLLSACRSQSVLWTAHFQALDVLRQMQKARFFSSSTLHVVNQSQLHLHIPWGSQC